MCPFGEFGMINVIFHKRGTSFDEEVRTKAMAKKEEMP
jgi:hypothetical protein